MTKRIFLKARCMKHILKELISITMEALSLFQFNIRILSLWDRQSFIQIVLTVQFIFNGTSQMLVESLVFKCQYKFQQQVVQINIFLIFLVLLIFMLNL
jgi:hypothetical protein